MRDAGVIRVLGELLLEDPGGLEPRGVRLVGRELRPREVQRVEDLRLVIAWVFHRERLVGLGARELARAFRTVGEVLVVGGHRIEVIALALGLRAHLPSLVDRGLRPRRVLGRGADSLERVRHQDRSESPGRDGAGIVFRGDLLEGLFRRGIVERVQHRHGALELRLDFGIAGRGETHIAEFFLGARTRSK